MPEPIAAPTAPVVVELEAAISPAPSRSFAEVLAEAPTQSPGPEFGQLLAGAARSIAEGRHAIDRAVARARRGGGLEPAALLSLQARVFRYTQELEVVGRLVDKSTQAVRQTLQSQQ